MSQIATKKRIGAEAVEEKGWLGAHKWLLLRRISQLSILALFLLGPLAGIWNVKGNLNYSYTLGVLPAKLAKGELGAHYRVGWEEQKKAGHSLIDESQIQDLPDRLPEGAVLPGHYDPATGHTEPMRGVAGSEAGAIPSLPPGLGGKP